MFFNFLVTQINVCHRNQVIKHTHIFIPSIIRIAAMSTYGSSAAYPWTAAQQAVLEDTWYSDLLNTTTGAQDLHGKMTGIGVTGLLFRQTVNDEKFFCHRFSRSRCQMRDLIIFILNILTGLCMTPGSIKNRQEVKNDLHSHVP